MGAGTLTKILVVFSGAVVVPAMTKAQAPCIPPTPSLRYPAEAMEQKVSGSVSIEFTINRRGEPSNVERAGDPLLAPTVEFAFTRLRFPPKCRGQRVTARFTFRIDPTLPLDAPEVVRYVAAGQYELVSPARNVVVISDPPVECSGCGLRWRILRCLRKLKFW
jgi:TonB family protein